MRGKIGNSEAERGSQAARCDQQGNADNARPHGSDWFEVRVAPQDLTSPASVRPRLGHVDIDRCIAARAGRSVDRLEFEPAFSALAPHHQHPLADGTTDRMFDDFDSFREARNLRQPGGVVIITDDACGRVQGAEDLGPLQQVRHIILRRRGSRFCFRVRSRAVFHGGLHRRVFACPARAPHRVRAGRRRALSITRDCNPVSTVFWHDRQTTPRARSTDPGYQTLDCGA